MPSLEPVPRTSTTIIAYPFEGKIVLPSETPAPDLRYGVCTRIVGHGHPVVGMYSSESRSTPSDMGILTSATTSYDVVAAGALAGAIRAHTSEQSSRAVEPR